MIYKEKFVSDEIISKLPNWLIHFLWYLLEENVQADPSFNGCFFLQRASEGQCISCQVNGKLRRKSLTVKTNSFSHCGIDKTIRSDE